MEWEPISIYSEDGLASVRNCHKCCTLGSSIYSFGGISKRCTNEIRVLDLDNSDKGWVVPKIVNLEDAPAPRQSAACCMVGTDMWVFGGSSRTSLFNDIYKFDTVENRWHCINARGEPPLARDRHSVCHINNCLYIFGGHSAEKEYNNDLYKFDIAERRWTLVRVLTRKPTSRYDHTAEAFGDEFIIFGGKYESGCFNDVHKFNTKTLEWSTPNVVGIFPAGRWGHASAQAGKHIIVFGGWNGTWCFNDMHILDVEEWQWSRSSLNEFLPIPRAFHACAIVQERYIVFGGRNRKMRMNDTHQLPVSHLFDKNGASSSPLSNGSDEHKSADPRSPRENGTNSHKIPRSKPPPGCGREEWDVKDFHLRETLGTGTFGRVRFVKYKPNGKYYALKMLKKVEIVRLKQQNHILSEKAILDEIRHPFIVDMVGYFQDSKYIYFVLEYIVGGEFFTHLRRAGRFKLRPTVFYASQIVLIFEYLHSKKIVYRDLKPENLLVDLDGNLRLTDFGFAKIVNDRTWTLCGTPEYIAPEILLNQGHGEAVDWWALGILIYEMLCGSPPFVADDPMGIYQQILAGNIRFPAYVDTFSKDLIERLLKARIDERLGNLKNKHEDVKKHPFFVGVDWNAAYNKELRPPFRPDVRGKTDTGQFEDYPDSDDEPEDLILEDDPFRDF